MLCHSKAFPPNTKVDSIVQSILNVTNFRRVIHVACFYTALIKCVRMSFAFFFVCGCELSRIL